MLGEYDSNTYTDVETLAEWELESVQEELTALRIKPSKSDTNGIKRAISVYSALSSEVGTRFSFELIFTGTATHFQIVCNESMEMKVRATVKEHYENAQIESGEITFTETTDGAVAARELNYTNDYWNPLKGLDRSEFEFDSYKDFINDFSNPATRYPVILQFVFLPVEDAVWQQRFTLAGFPVFPVYSLSQEVDKFKHNQKQISSHAQSQDVKEAYQNLVTSREERAFITSVRLLAFGADPDEASQRADSILSSLNTTFSRSKPPQSFQFRGPRQKDAQTVLYEAFRRDLDFDSSLKSKLTKTRKRPTVIPVPVLAHLAHLPGPEVGNPTIDWAMENDDGDFPLGAPRFEDETDADA